jgi:hypothetical protein
MQRTRMSRSYASSLPWHLHGIAGQLFTYIHKKIQTYKTDTMVSSAGAPSILADLSTLQGPETSAKGMAFQ